MLETFHTPLVYPVHRLQRCKDQQTTVNRTPLTATTASQRYTRSTAGPADNCQQNTAHGNNSESTVYPVHCRTSRQPSTEHRSRQQQRVNGIPGPLQDQQTTVNGTPLTATTASQRYTRSTAGPADNRQRNTAHGNNSESTVYPVHCRTSRQLSTEHRSRQQQRVNGIPGPLQDQQTTVNGTEWKPAI